MRYIDMQTWSRRDHFRMFNSFNHPHFSMSANIDLTAFNSDVKQRGLSFTLAIVYVISRASNAIPEFRYRIRVDQVVEHEIVNPSFTILVDDDIFSFCTVDYTEEFPVFAARAAEHMAKVKKHLELANDPERDDYLFMSTIPWVSFTSFIHPMQFHPTDSIPRFAWGKMFEEGGLLKLPLSVQGHHALMDGIHMGRFYEKVQDYCSRPEDVLGEV
ncbi:MAG: chloramphenicol acetyltransferase [Candidatus Heimdallarchaeota archaeon]|nr:MAG: chloramphenicol acetyltransferase [Candidatus Heimdallarchaeota archaeon]